MGHIHSVYDTDNHFKINGSTRQITKESAGETLVVQYDHNSEIFTFELPRIIEGHDMMLCNEVQVQYQNMSTSRLRGNKGMYIVEDLQVSPDDENILICSWLISSNATQYEGILEFLLRFACRNGEELDYVWNTATCSDVKVSNGMYHGNDIAEEYPDIISGLIEDVEELKKASDPASSLPDVTEDDNGKHLEVQGGEWVVKKPDSVTSWNDLAERPFSDAPVVYFEYHEGYVPLDSMLYLEGTNTYLYKVSNTPLTKDELVGSIAEMGTLAGSTGYTIEEDALIIEDDCIYNLDQPVCSVFKDCTIQGLSLTRGLWVAFSETMYIVKLHRETPVTLPIRYLPEELYTQIDARIDAYIEEALGGEY